MGETTEKPRQAVVTEVDRRTVEDGCGVFPLKKRVRMADADDNTVPLPAKVVCVMDHVRMHFGNSVYAILTAKQATELAEYLYLAAEQAADWTPE
jgi:hypothetical protein